MNMRQALDSRWKPHWEGRAPFRKVVQARARVSEAWDAAQQAGELRTKLQNEGRLSAKGIDETLRDNLGSGVVAKLHRARHAVKTVRAEIGVTRAAMGIPKPNPSDAAGAILRSEYRAFLRGLGMAEVGKLLADPNVDPALLQAAWEVPAPMVGIPEEMRENLRTVILERTHAEEVALLGELEEAATLVDSAIEGGFMEIAGAAGFRSPQDSGFRTWIEQSTRAVDAEIEAETRQTPPLTPLDLKAVADAVREMTKEQQRAFSDYAFECQVASISGKPLPDAVRFVDPV